MVWLRFSCHFQLERMHFCKDSAPNAAHSPRANRNQCWQRCKGCLCFCTRCRQLDPIANQVLCGAAFTVGAPFHVRLDSVGCVCSLQHQRLFLENVNLLASCTFVLSHCHFRQLLALEGGPVKVKFGSLATCHLWCLNTNIWRKEGDFSLQHWFCQMFGPE